METLVMIPAFGCDGRLYKHQMEALQGRIRIVLHVPGENRFEAMTTSLLAKVDGHFAVLGTSMGGRLALEVAMAAADRVKALCVIGAGAGAVADQAAAHRRTSRIQNGEKDDVIREMAEMVSYAAGPNAMAARSAMIAMAAEMDAATLARQSEAIAHRQDCWRQAGMIGCATLCLWGSFDHFAPPAQGRELAATVRNGRYVEIAACGHFPTLEYPDQATAAITAWLADAGLI